MAIWRRHTKSPGKVDIPTRAETFKMADMPFPFLLDWGVKPLETELPLFAISFSFVVKIYLHLLVTKISNMIIFNLPRTKQLPASEVLPHRSHFPLREQWLASTAPHLRFHPLGQRGKFPPHLKSIFWSWSILVIKRHLCLG